MANPSSWRTALLMGFCLLCSRSALFGEEEPQERQEPAQIFSLEFDGKKAAISLDTPFDLSSLDGSKTITLRVEPYRVFPYAGLRFHYPREYTFAADFTNADIAIWTLSGPDYTIMVQRMNGQKQHEFLRRQVAKEMQRLYRTAKQSETTLEVKGKTLRGLLLEATIASNTIRQSVFSLPSGGDSIILILQDSPENDGKPSRDRIRAEKQFCETLQMPGN